MRHWHLFGEVYCVASPKRSLILGVNPTSSVQKQNKSTGVQNFFEKDFTEALIPGAGVGLGHYRLAYLSSGLGSLETWLSKRGCFAVELIKGWGVWWEILALLVSSTLRH